MWGQGAKVSSAAELARDADNLKPGQWVWAPVVAPEGPVLVYIDLSRQLVTVYRNGVRIGVSTISSGKKNHDTPTGVFTILQKRVKHYSNLYNNAPMPYMQRLTWGGVALHAGHDPGYAASHGCIRLPYNFAKALFGVTKSGTTVVVAGDAVEKVETEEGSLLAPVEENGEAASQEFLKGAEFRWTPERSSTGPVTIIISKKDQRIVVLRNGVEIGRSKAEVDDDDPLVHVLNLTVGPDGTRRWVFVELPGRADEGGRVADQATLDRVRMPRRFFDAVQTELQPGTTVLVTQSSVGTQAASGPVTILDGVSPKGK